jgi:hypothetical protein
MKGVALSALQFTVVVGVCALLGYSLSRFPGSESVAPWVPTTIGAAVGVLAFVIAPLFAPLARREESVAEHKPGLRFSYMVGFLGAGIAAAGFLLAVLAAPVIGMYVFVLGWAITVFAFILFASEKMRPNTTPHADARDVPASAGDSGARAGGRER